MIITVPKSYVVSGLPLRCNKDDFTLTEPATCKSVLSVQFLSSYRLICIHQSRILSFRSFPVFLLPDLPSSVTALSFLLSSWVTAWLTFVTYKSVVYVQFLSSYCLTHVYYLQLLRFIQFLSSYCLTYFRHLQLCHFCSFSELVLPKFLTYNSVVSILFLSSYCLMRFRELQFSCLCPVPDFLPPGSLPSVNLCCYPTFSAFLLPGLYPSFSALLFPFISYVPTAWLTSVTCESLASASLPAFLPHSRLRHLITALLPPGSRLSLERRYYPSYSKHTCLFVALFVVDRGLMCNKLQYFIWLIHHTCIIV
jgi:hypothetical protein